MIRIEGLHKYYGTDEARTHVLDGVDLTIDDGEFVAIIGTSGSGKTTLLNIIGGLDRSYEGRVHIDEKNLAEMRERDLATLRNQHFGFVFQQFNLLDHLTSQENVTLPSFFAPGGQDPKAARARSKELLERVGLQDKLDAVPPHLSGGQKQRVAIARALFHQPSVILCDEPTGSLDRNTGIQILDLFRELNDDEGITLIMVTHEEHIARMSRRIIRLEDGVVVSDERNVPAAPDAELLTSSVGAASMSTPSSSGPAVATAGDAEETP